MYLATVSSCLEKSVGHIFTFRQFTQNCLRFWGRIQRKHGVWVPMPELTITMHTLCSLQSRLHIYHGQPMPESTLTLCQSRLHPPDFRFCLWCQIWLHPQTSSRYRQQLLVTLLPTVEEILPQWKYVCDVLQESMHCCAANAIFCCKVNRSLFGRCCIWRLGTCSWDNNTRECTKCALNTGSLWPQRK